MLKKIVVGAVGGIIGRHGCREVEFGVAVRDQQFQALQ